MDSQSDQNCSINDNHSEIIAMIAHQIRSPLATIRLTHQTLLEGEGLTEQQINLLEQANKRADRIHKLTEELIKVERGAYSSAKLNLTQTRIEDFVDSLLDQSSVSIQAKDLMVVRDYDDQTPEVSIDCSLMTDVLTNLIDNAVSYTPQGGTVTISTKHEGDKVLVKVSDSGVGIAENEAEQLFKKYSRLQSGKEHRRDGLGLGLYVAKMAVEKHGGKLWYEPNKPYGSSFIFTLPTT